MMLLERYDCSDCWRERERGRGNCRSCLSSRHPEGGAFRCFPFRGQSLRFSAAAQTPPDEFPHVQLHGATHRIDSRSASYSCTRTYMHTCSHNPCIHMHTHTQMCTVPGSPLSSSVAASIIFHRCCCEWCLVDSLCHDLCQRRSRIGECGQHHWIPRDGRSHVVVRRSSSKLEPRSVACRCIERCHDCSNGIGLE